MDYDQSLLDEFVAEGKEHLESIEDDFLSLEKQQGNLDREVVDKVFRAMHSIKGSAGIFGFTKIGELAHIMETLLSMVRENELRPDSPFTNAMLGGVDRLNAMLDDLNHSNEMDIASVHAQLVDILEQNVSEDEKGKLHSEVTVSDSNSVDTGFTIDEFTLSRLPASNYLFALAFDLSELSRQEGISPITLIRDLVKTGEIVDSRVEASAQDLKHGLPTGPLIFSVLYDTCMDREMVSLALGIAEDSVTDVPKDTATKPTEANNVQPNLPQPLVRPEVEEKDQTPPRTQTSKAHASSIRVNVELLDELMLLAGELVLVRNQQLLVAEKSDSISQGIVQHLDLVTTELQETIMRTRMQQIGNVFNKFPRIVRDLGQKLGKDMRLDISGNEVEVDKTILESLADPLTHLIRNSCDHGIETPAHRESNGKPPQGTISLRAFHEAGHINIEITDDGAGIDPQIVRNKALEKELKTEAELDAMSDEEIASLVLLPGFSTAEELSDLSGRGVGMDVVCTSIAKLGGSIDLRSTLGLGTTVQLRLPLTLAIIPCLIIKAGGNRYAIPQINLDELVCLYDDDVVTKLEYADNREVYRLRDHLLSMVRLPEILGDPTPFTETVRAEMAENNRKALTEKVEGISEGGSTSQSLNFAVVKIGAARFGLIIDEVLGTEEIVVKPMHPSLKSLACYSGATIMGDGKVALILDIEGVARHSGVLHEREDETMSSETQGVEKQPLLLFKSGDQETFAVALPLISRIERVQTSEIEEIGDKEFITVDGVTTRVLRLHQHLTVSPCENHEEMYLLLPKYTKHPFGILMSSLIDIVDVPIQLNVDSYREDGLLGTDIIRDQMTIFLDLFRLIELAEPTWFAHSAEDLPQGDDRKDVLLLEDSSFFCELVKGYLQVGGYNVRTARDGQEGVDLLAEEKFDLIVSDIEMPVMDGHEFIRTVRADPLNREIPAIALASLESEKDRALALESGFDHYQVKIDRDKLLASAANLIESRQSVLA